MHNQLVPHAEEGGGEMPSDIDSNLITAIDSVSYFKNYINISYINELNYIQYLINIHHIIMPECLYKYEL